MKKAILGIDVSKKELVVALLFGDAKKISTFTNNNQGYRLLNPEFDTIEGKLLKYICASFKSSTTKLEVVIFWYRNI